MNLDDLEEILDLIRAKAKKSKTPPVDPVLYPVDFAIHVLSAYAVRLNNWCKSEIAKRN
jgi:hypothetical protein